MKKSRGADFWKIITFIVIVLLVLGIAFLFSDYNDPENLLPDEHSITGNAIFNAEEPSIEDLENGINLPAGFTKIIWNSDLDSAPITTAFSSILDNVLYVIDFSQSTYLYYINPNIDPPIGHSDLVNERPFTDQRLTEIIPGNRYYIKLVNPDTLQYSQGSNVENNEILEDFVSMNGEIIDQNTGERLDLPRNTIVSIDITGTTTFIQEFNSIEIDQEVVLEICRGIDDGVISVNNDEESQTIGFGEVNDFANCFFKIAPSGQCTEEIFNRLDYNDDNFIDFLDLEKFRSCFGLKLLEVSE